MPVAPKIIHAQLHVLGPCGRLFLALFPVAWCQAGRTGSVTVPTEEFKLNIYFSASTTTCLSLLLRATVHGRHLLLLYKTAAAASCSLRRSHKPTGAALFVLLLVL